MMHNFSTLTLAIFLFSAIGLLGQSSTWQQVPGPEGGNIYSLAQNGNTWYAAAGSSIFASTNQGETWSRQPWAPKGGFATGIYADSTEILMLALLEDTSGFSSFYHIGTLFRSTDAGQSWDISTIPGQFFDYDQIKVFRHRGFIFVTRSADGMISRSADNGQSWTTVSSFSGVSSDFSHNDSLLLTSDGFFTSFFSNDGGDTWTEVSSPPGGGLSKAGLGRGNTIFIFNEYHASYKSINLGGTWTSIGNTFYYSEVGSTRLLPDGKIAALVSYPDGDEMIFISADDGNTWSKFNGSPFAQAIDVIGNDGLYGVSTMTGFYRNYTGGNFLNPFNTGLYAADVKSMKKVNGQMLAGSTEGLWRSFDDGQNWFSTFPQQVLAGTVDIQTTGDTLCALTNYDFLYSTDNGDTWNAPYTGSSNLFWYGAERMAVDGKNIIVGAYDLFVSKDFGTSWTEFSNYSRVSGVLIADGLYFGIAYWDGIIRSVDQGNSWQLVKNDIIGEGRLYYLHNKIFAVTTLNTYYSEDMGSTWQAMTGIPVSGNYPMTIGAMAANDTVIFAGVNGAGVFQSKDGGESWELFSDNMPINYFNDLMIVDDMLYAALKSGGIWKYNLGTSPVRAPVSAQRLVLMPNPVGLQPLTVIWDGAATENMEWKIIDALGRCVATPVSQSVNGQIQLNIRSLAAGIYQLTGSAGQEIRVGTFIKN